eukprot:244197-Pyramimonas_sp.AAC.1
MAGKDVVKGPKVPYWGCRACGRTSNWAHSLRCRCGAPAPKHFLEKAKALGGVSDGPGRNPNGGGAAPKSLGDRQQSKLEKQITEMQKRFDSFIKSAQPRGGAGGPKRPGGGSAAPTQDKEEAEDDPL